MATSLDKVDAYALHNNISQPLEIVASGDDPFYLYPNETLLLLGDWYWNQGHQKSQVSFRMLLDIIGHPGYSLEDVWKTNWTAIDWKLGNSSVWDDKTETDCDWLDHDSVTLRLGHSASKPKGLFVCYTGCLPRVSTPWIGTQLVQRLDFSKVLNSNLNHCGPVDLDVVRWASWERFERLVWDKTSRFG